MEYIHTDERFREDEDGYMVKEVFVPSGESDGEWMDEDEYKFNKTCLDGAMEDAERYWNEHGC